ncbi:hypothetical protein [Limisalsivibrio acetivorans]|nr:hypothetical protein [Limisalsivibrio acetivorans]
MGVHKNKDGFEELKHDAKEGYMPIFVGVLAIILAYLIFIFMYYGAEKL